MPAIALNAPAEPVRPATFALSRAEAETMGRAAADAGTTLVGIKAAVAARGYKRDGTTMERVLAAYLDQKAKPKSPYTLTGGLPMRVPPSYA
ncbi:MAG: hypothetical protein ACRYHQ_05440 [Janthinobacterium lividum]